MNATLLQRHSAGTKPRDRLETEKDRKVQLVSSPQPTARRSRRAVAALLITTGLVATGLLAACAQPLRASPPTQEQAGAATARYSHTQRVALTPGETAEAVTAQHGGEVVVWRPEQGFAVLGLDGRTALHTLSAELEPNHRVMDTPESSASASMGGRRTWSGGRRTWSGGTGTNFAAAHNTAAWERIRLPQAHALAPRLGAGVKVAVIDTGLELGHPAFSGRLAPAGEWYDFVDNDTLPQEVAQGSSDGGYGHGTAVAGIVLQVAPNATILPLRVLGPDGSGDTTDVAAAMDWAVAKGAEVIQLSLGTTSDSQVLKTMLEYATSRGVFVIASSGNTGDERITYPAAYTREGGLWGDLSIGVGSVDERDAKSAFSTYGGRLELLAPGEQIYTPAPGDQLAHWSGTSVAAPMIAGALALALGEDTSTTKRAELALLIGETATEVDDDDLHGEAYEEYFDDKLGEGRLNVAAFVSEAQGLGELDDDDDDD